MELVEERRKRNTTERVMRATASSYVISPAALPTVAPDPDARGPAFSAVAAGPRGADGAGAGGAHSAFSGRQAASCDLCDRQ